MNLQEYIKESKADPGVFWRLDTGDHGNLLDEAIEEITRIHCDAVECHQGRDVLASLREAMARLPCCGTAAIMAAATQEIQGLRDAISQTLDENGHLADGENCTLIGLKKALRTSGAPWSGDKNMGRCSGADMPGCSSLCRHSEPHVECANCTPEVCVMVGSAVKCRPINQGE